MSSEGFATDLAGAILDGQPIDWSLLKSDTGADARALLDPFRILATVAAVHRQAPPHPPPPERWGPLRVLERLGRGAYGEVYRAWDPALDREVALKLLSVRPVAGTPQADAIIEEGRLLARVHHPNVVTIYGADRIDDRIGLWMELVRGRTLEQALEEGKPFAAAEAAAIGVQLCRAVAAVHEAGLLHRDIKAHNVMLAEDGRVVLMDFGAGRRLDDEFGTELAGTPLYLAPEVLQGGEATVRSDIYSLGVLLYHLCTGEYPVNARSLAELQLAHARRARGDSETRPRHPAVLSRLAAVLERAMDPRPDYRHASAAALERELEAVAKGWRAHGRSIMLVAAVTIALAVACLTVVRPSPTAGLAGNGAPPAHAAVRREPVRLAVLPFDAGHDDPDLDVLSEGVARGVISRLQAYDNAEVMATTTAFSAAAMNLPLAEIGARLGVSTVVTGRVLRSGDSVALEAKLLRLPDEQILWQGRHTRPRAELPDLQRTIALDIAAALGLQRQTGSAAGETRNLEAYALYVRGVIALDKFTRQGTRLALQHFEQAIELDPAYAQAHAGVALCYVQVVPAVPNLPGREALRRATEAANRAMSLDASIPEVHVAQALIRSAHADWTGAERHFLRAIELGPSHSVARQRYAHWLALLGRSAESIEQARIAGSLDPLSPRALMSLASALRFAGLYEEAIQQARRVLALDPTQTVAHLNLGHNYLGLGRLEEAIAAFEKVPLKGNLGHAYALAGRTAEARALIAELEKQYEQTRLNAGEIAQIYAGLGEIDRAFEWLDRQDPYHTGWPTTLKVAPVWDPLRADPRFRVLLKRYGLAN